ncbi:MAG: hypothetical protein ABIJ65_09960 [Chloroflexota bacterium]
MQIPSRRRILLCLFTFPLSGILALGALFMRKFVGMPGADPGVWAAVVTSNRYVIAQYLFILAYVLPFLGFWALYMVLMQHNTEKLAFWGLVGTLIGTGLPLTTLGVFAYASPALGKLYLLGDTHLPQVITEIAMGSSMVMGLPGAVFYVSGCILFGIAIWRSFPSVKWSGILFGLHGILVSLGFGSALMLSLSWMFLIASGTGLMMGVQKEAVKTNLG